MREGTSPLHGRDVLGRTLMMIRNLASSSAFNRLFQGNIGLRLPCTHHPGLRRFDPGPRLMEVQVKRSLPGGKKHQRTSLFFCSRSMRSEVFPAAVALPATTD